MSTFSAGRSNPATRSPSRSADGTEEEWDEFRCGELLRESDARGNKYRDLLEKYLDHPDRDRIIAREMGWTWLEDALDEKDSSEPDKTFIKRLPLPVRLAPIRLSPRRASPISEPSSSQFARKSSPSWRRYGSAGPNSAEMPT
ncbi:MAG TPA: hypothetical protein VN921_00670 [Chthoniobacterales bacterium]|nr:hypothetical protein [Chthoniobacterales bacterium]